MGSFNLKIHQNTPKFVFGRGSASDPTGGAYDAPPDPLVGWRGGHLLPVPLPHSPPPIPLPVAAFGVSSRS